MELNVLNDVQNELREPRYSDHDYRGCETASKAEQTHRGRELVYKARRAEAAKWLSDQRRLEADLGMTLEDAADKDIGCLLALGDYIAGWGVGMGEAMEDAKRRGFNPRECLVVFLPGF